MLKMLLKISINYYEEQTSTTICNFLLDEKHTVNKHINKPRQEHVTSYTSMVLSTLVCFCRSSPISPFSPWKSTFCSSPNFFIALSSLLARRLCSRNGKMDSWICPTICVVISKAAKC